MTTPGSSSAADPEHSGARRVTFTVQAHPGGGSHIEIGDDGEGMTWDHATRFLFTLYASSKTTSPGAVGRFGVGFWSVLRIKPSQVSISSWPAHGEPWHLDLALDDARASRRAPEPASSERSGTRIGVQVAFPPAAVCDALRDTAAQTARFVRRLREDRPLEIVVDGHRVDRPFSLPSPSIDFRGRGFRGCVGFGSSSSVELFARGLRVRAASSLAALLGDDPRLAVSRLKFTDLEGGLAPQIILEVDDLELDLSRSHPLARGQLDRAIARARRETEALVAAQLEQVDPRSLRARWRALIRAPRRAALAGSLALCALAVGVAADHIIAPGTGCHPPPPPLPRPHLLWRMPRRATERQTRIAISRVGTSDLARHPTASPRRATASPSSISPRTPRSTSRWSACQATPSRHLPRGSIPLECALQRSRGALETASSSLWRSISRRGSPASLSRRDSGWSARADDGPTAPWQRSGSSPTGCPR